jgi:hypothetical protein
MSAVQSSYIDMVANPGLSRYQGAWMSFVSPEFSPADTLCYHTANATVFPSPPPVGSVSVNFAGGWFGAFSFPLCHADTFFSSHVLSLPSCATNTAEGHPGIGGPNLLTSVHAITSYTVC